MCGWCPSVRCFSEPRAVQPATPRDARFSFICPHASSLLITPLLRSPLRFLIPTSPRRRRLLLRPALRSRSGTRSPCGPGTFAPIPAPSAATPSTSPPSSTRPTRPRPTTTVCLLPSETAATSFTSTASSAGSAPGPSAPCATRSGTLPRSSASRATVRSESSYSIELLVGPVGAGGIASFLGGYCIPFSDCI